MAESQAIAETYGTLRDLCDGLISEDCLNGNDDGFKAGERYYALSWLIADILEQNVEIPEDPLLNAYDLLEDTDKDNYKAMLDRWLKNKDQPAEQR